MQSLMPSSLISIGLFQYLVPSSFHKSSQRRLSRTVPFFKKQYYIQRSRQQTVDITPKHRCCYPPFPFPFSQYRTFYTVSVSFISAHNHEEQKDQQQQQQTFGGCYLYRSSMHILLGKSRARSGFCTLSSFAAGSCTAPCCCGCHGYDLAVASMEHSNDRISVRCGIAVTFLLHIIVEE